MFANWRCMPTSWSRILAPARWKNGIRIKSRCARKFRIDHGAAKGFGQTGPYKDRVGFGAIGDTEISILYFHES